MHIWDWLRKREHHTRFYTGTLRLKGGPLHKHLVKLVVVTAQMLATPMALASLLISAKLIPKLVCTSTPLWLRCSGLVYILWIFWPPNGIMATKQDIFWISAGRELAEVMLSMNQYCWIILIALQQSLLSTMDENWDQKNSQALQSIWNILLPPPLREIHLKFSRLSFWKAVELESIQSFRQQIHSVCLAMKANRGISCFPLEMFIKTSFSWQELCIHAPNMYLLMLFTLLMLGIPELQLVLQLSAD